MPISEYYRALREKTGSGLLMVPSVAAVIRNDDEEILFIRKGKEQLWGLPAGAIEPGETPSRRCAERFLKRRG